MKKIFILFALLLSFSIVYAQASGIEITEYENNILVEKGWIRYLSVEVKNVGDVYLNNVEIYVSGEKSNWFESQSEPTSIAPNDTASLLLKLYVPLNEERGEYQFSLTASSEEASTSESFTVEIFTSKTEMLLDQIQNFREEINELKVEADDAEIRGKNVDSVKLMLLEAQSLVEAASNDVYNRLFDDATEKIRDVEILLKKAEYDLSVASDKPISQTMGFPFEWILIIALLIIIVSMFFWFFVFRRHEKTRKVSGKVPGLKIKRLMMQEKEWREPVEEIKSLEEAKSLLEEEYREGLLSKESYEEMKSKYEEKILNLKTKK